MKILITGFEPFGTNKYNPSWEAVRQLQAPEGVEFVKLRLPVEFQNAPRLLLEAVRDLKPDAVLCVGLAEGRVEITPERVAINCMDARIPDNAGFQPQDEPIAPDGQTAYFSCLPIREIAKAIQAEGIPAKISNTAGTYVCNALMYRLLQTIDQEPQFKDVCGGFIHVPATPDMGLPKGTPTMELNQIVRALQIAVDVVSKHAAMKIDGSGVISAKPAFSAFCG